MTASNGKTYAEMYPNASELVRAVKKALDYGADRGDIFLYLEKVGGYEHAYSALSEADDLTHPTG